MIFYLEVLFFFNNRKFRCFYYTQSQTLINTHNYNVSPSFALIKNFNLGCYN